MAGPLFKARQGSWEVTVWQNKQGLGCQLVRTMKDKETGEWQVISKLHLYPRDLDTLINLLDKARRYEGVIDELETRQPMDNRSSSRRERPAQQTVKETKNETPQPSFDDDDIPF